MLEEHIMRNGIRRLIAVMSLAAVAACLALSASAQQNTLIGTWFTDVPGPYGPETITYFQFLPDGTVNMQFYKRGANNAHGALNFQEIGRYQFAGETLQYQFTDYAPKGQVIPPPDLGVPRQVGIRFIDPNTFVTSDNATYHRSQ
jgi:hypothetical protein